MKRINWKNIILLIVLYVILVGCQPVDKTIYFNENMTLQVGDKQHPLSLIDKIGDTKITKDMISGNVLTCGNVSIECDSIDTSDIGTYDVTYKTNDNKNHYITKTIHVADMIAPQIVFQGLKDNNSLELTKQQFNDYNFAKNVSVKDNYDDSPKTSVSIKERKKDVEYIVLVESIDKYGNKATKEMVVKIIEEKKENKDSKNQILSNDNSSKKDNQTHKKVDENKNTNHSDHSQSISKKYPRKSQTFYFGKTYELNGNMVECNMDNVTSICSSRMSGNSECVPLKDSNGIYIGMKLTFR